jgi:protein NrfC
MNDQEDRKQKTSDDELSRRDFLKVTGTFVIGVGVDGSSALNKIHPQLIKLKDGRTGIAVSEGYLLVDTKKCQGCVSCMLACSLVHEGVEDLSLSRIQVMQNSFEKWPDDLTIEQCRQCVDPACVAACPASALEANSKYENVRMVDKAKCIGCGSCIQACPYTPSRAIWNSKDRYAQICDLCANSPYHWDEIGGGPDGKQACVEVCPVSAIKFTKEIPEQEGETGYKVNLRGENWKNLGYPVE